MFEPNQPAGFIFRAWKDIGALVLIGVVVVIFFFRLFFPIPKLIMTPDFGRSDAWSFSFSTKYMLAENLKHGTWPLWSRLVGDGFPIQAEGQIGTFFLPNLLLFRLFDVVTAYNIALLLTFVTGGVGMYAWLRLTKFPVAVSLFSALAFTFSGLMVPHLTHITLLQGFTLLPALMAITYLFAKRPSPFLMCVFALVASQQFLAGFPQASFVTLIFTSAYFIWIIRTERHKVSCVFYYTGALLLMGLLSMVQLLPSKEFLTTILNADGFSLYDASFYSFPFRNILTLIYPFIFGSPANGSYMQANIYGGNVFWENVAYIGIIPTFSICGLLFYDHRKFFRAPQIFFALSACVAFLLMTGRHSPVYFIYSFWPFELFRVPSRFIWIFVTSLLVLSTAGLHKLLRTIRPAAGKVLLLTICVLISGYFGVRYWWNYHILEPAKNVLSAPAFARYVSPDDRTDGLFTTERYSSEFIRSGWTHPEVYQLFQNTFPANGNVIWHIDAHEVASGRSLRRASIIDSLIGVSETIDDTRTTATVSAFGEKVLSLTGTSKLISNVPDLRTTFVPMATISAGIQHMTMYQNPSAVPKAYVASDVRLAHSVQDVGMILKDTTFIPGASVILESSPSAVLSDSPVSIQRVRERDTEEIFRVTGGTTNQMFVVNETYYPGWKAYIDGTDAPILPANIRYRAIFLPKGDHTVRFVYDPPFFRVGLWISILSYAGVIGWAFLSAFLSSRTRP